MEEVGKAFPPAVAICGMHRSGTSLTATLLAAAGVHLGDDMMTAAAGEPDDHRDDLEFHGLHRRILAANGLSLEGYTCQQVIAVPSPLRAEAMELVRRRRATGRPWGWQDPRTVLLLDFWAELVPEARWLFVLRPPEEVVDSLFRHGDPAFVFNPRHAVDIWTAYNRQILEFVHRHAAGSVVVELARVISDPDGLVAAVADVMGTVLATPTPPNEPAVLTARQPARRAEFVRVLDPETRDLHGKLLRLAGSDDGPVPSRDPPVAAIAEAALAEWAAGCRALAERDISASRAAKARQAADRAELELTAVRAARAEAIAQGDALAAKMGALQADMAEESRRRAAAEARCIELEQERVRVAAARDVLTDRCEALTEEAVAASAALAALQTAKADLADRTRVIGHLEAAVAEARSLADRTRQEVDVLAAERDDLIAQLEAERAIHESLRRDMTDRIEAVVTGRR